MTLFEYLAIAFSLVLSLAGMRLIAGLPHAAQPGRRYWVHLCLASWQLVLTVFVFWLFWTFRSVTWNFLTFVLVLMSPGLIYLNACTLIPESPSSVESWREYFYSVRRRYFLGLSCWVVTTVAISTVVAGYPLLHPSRGIQAVTLSVCVAGALSRSHRVQATIAVSFLALALLLAFVLGLQPDFLAPP